MKRSLRIIKYGLASALLLSSIHAGAYDTPWYKRTGQSLAQHTRKAADSCKNRFYSVKNRLQRRWTQKQLLIAYFIALFLLEGTLFSLVPLIEYKMPYTEAKLLRAFSKDCKEIINDYLDNRRVEPNGFIDGRRLLSLAIERSLYGTTKLLKMGIDPRSTNHETKSVIAELKPDLDTSSLLLELPFSNAIRAACTVMAHADALSRKEMKQMLHCANRNKCHKLPSDMLTEIYKHLQSTDASSDEREQFRE